MVFADGPLFRHGVRSAAVALNAHRPSPKNPVAAMPSFAFSLAVSEYPLLALGVSQQRRAGIMATRGLPVTPVGWAGLGLASAADLGYLHLFDRSRRVGGLLGDALKAELGDDYTEDMAPPIEARQRRRGTGLQRVREVDPLRRYVRAADVEYGPYGPANRLDIWRRKDLADDGRAPVIIQIPGGAWVIGSKNWQGRPLLSHLVERGWVCVAINYRHAPRQPWPAQIVDVKRAIAWVKENIADHGGDPEFVVTTGGSAGGHLASLAALTPGVKDFQPGFEDVDTSVQASVPFYGVFDFLDEENVSTPRFREYLAGRDAVRSEEGPGSLGAGIAHQPRRRPRAALHAAARRQRPPRQPRPERGVRRAVACHLAEQRGPRRTAARAARVRSHAVDPHHPVGPRRAPVPRVDMAGQPAAGRDSLPRAEPARCEQTAQDCRRPPSEVRGVVSVRQRLTVLVELWKKAPRRVRQTIVLMLGGTVIALGLALIVLPGPFTLPLLILGFAILGTEFAWATTCTRTDQGWDGRRRPGRQAGRVHGCGARRTPPPPTLSANPPGSQVPGCEEAGT